MNVGEINLSTSMVCHVNGGCETASSFALILCTVIFFFLFTNRVLLKAQCGKKKTFVASGGETVYSKQINTSVFIVFSDQ